MKDIFVTPELLKSLQPCETGYRWGLEQIGKGLTLSKFLSKFERTDWLFWLLKYTCKLNKLQYVELAILSAKAVFTMYKKKYPKDKRPQNAIEAAKNYLKNPTKDNRKAAAYAANASDAAYVPTNVSISAVNVKYNKKLCQLIYRRLKKWGFEK